MSNDEKDPRERLEAEVLSLLREKFYLRENGDGAFSQEIYADYRDEMDDKTPLKSANRMTRVRRSRRRCTNGTTTTRPTFARSF